MRIPYFVIFLIVSLTIYISLLITKIFLSKFNKYIKIRNIFIISTVLTALAFIVHKTTAHDNFFFIFTRSTVLFLIMFNLTAIVSLSFSLIYLKIISIFNKKNKKKNNKEILVNQKTITRREFIKYGAFAFPITATIFSLEGIREGVKNSLIKKIALKYKNLPKELDGLRIAQISDLHLGTFIRISHLKKIINSLQKENIDILVITGDFVDDYALLEKSIKVLKKLKTSYGIYSSPGNHEYFRGIKPVIKAFKKENIPYLISEGLKIDINGKSIFLAGIDDPKKLSGDINKFMKNSIDKALINSNENDFKILMSHRPTAFLTAAKQNIELTLSGHTHGAQIGWKNRSLFESFQNHSFLWGHYKINDSQLYTTSGAGHWFPFRINCPTEVPIFILTSI